LFAGIARAIAPKDAKRSSGKAAATKARKSGKRRSS
jgi:hypothetical protein